MDTLDYLIAVVIVTGIIAAFWVFTKMSKPTGTGGSGGSRTPRGGGGHSDRKM